MNPHPSKLSGFSLTEMVIALAITTAVVIAATNGWIFLVRGERVNSSQTELDIDVRNSMENLKHDLRLSSLDKIYYYPAGPGPYTAISIPMTSDTNNDGLAEYVTGGSNILWTKTVIYHVWGGTPNELRKTVFSPRDNSLTPAQCQEQLNSVVTNGNGSQTYTASKASTRAIFKNLFNWVVWGSGATYDGYSPIVERDTGVSFGSIYMGAGSHLVKFNVIGKNAASSGYKIGVDTLTASACGVEREGEAQLPPSSQSGATAASEYMAQGSWSGNYHLSFPASAVGANFTLNIDNDRWEETNFRGQGALCTKTIVGFDQNLTPKDYIVHLEGSPGYPWSPVSAPSWTALGQTGSDASSISSNALRGCAVRVLLRGMAMNENNGNIRYSGSFPYVYFQASPSQPLYISAAFIAEASSSSNYTMNAASAGTQLYFGISSDPNQNISAGTTAWAAPQNLFEIDSTKSYLITYIVGNINASPMVWPESHTGAPGSYIIPDSANPTAADAQAASWTGKAYQTNLLYGVASLYSTYPANGLFTSQIFDTKIETPVYSTVSWNATCPANTSVKIKVRTGANADLSDAPNWTNVTAFLTSPANITCGNTRYVQFQAILNPDLASKGANSPKLKDVTIKWSGATKIVDVSATMTKGPNYGICEVTVDGQPLTKGLRIDLSIFKDITGWGKTGKRITSSMTTEIAPRNTGK